MGRSTTYHIYDIEKVQILSMVEAYPVIIIPLCAYPITITTTTGGYTPGMINITYYRRYIPSWCHYKMGRRTRMHMTYHCNQCQCFNHIHGKTHTPPPTLPNPHIKFPYGLLSPYWRWRRTRNKIKATFDPVWPNTITKVICFVQVKSRLAVLREK